MAYNFGNSSGNLILLQKQVVSGVSSLAFTGIGTTYDNIKLIYYNVTGNQNPNFINIQISYDNGSIYKSDSTYTITIIQYDSNPNNSAFASGQPNGRLLQQISNSSGSNHTAGEMIIWNANASVFPLMESSCAQAGRLNNNAKVVSSYQGSAGAVNAFQLVASAGTFSGTFKLYGIQN